MPTIDNSETGSGRVTRSLRKRLTSVDTDSSSRPGTPVISSLHTLQETVTPSKRNTRRTSVSTPVPTPSKVKGRIDITEVASSPARRSTRRRSLSTNEEDATMHVKSKEPAFDVVKEEETGEKSPELKSKRATRHSPKSALIHQSEQPRSETPKSDKTGSEQMHLSPEVSPRVLMHMKHSKVMVKKEHIDEKNLSVQKKNKQKQSKEATPQKSNPLIIDSSPEKMRSPEECGTEQNVVVEKLATPHKTSKSPPKNEDVKSNRSTHMRTPLKKDDEVSREKNNLSATKIPQDVPGPKKRGRPVKIKSVGFNNTAEEDEEKSVFPKTPGLTKSKSYILDSSKPDENEATRKFQTNSEHSHDEIDVASVKGDADADEDENEILSTKTPYKMKLNSVESSTPIQSSSARQSKNDSQQKDTSTNDTEGSKEDFAFPKSWSHSVSGTTNDLVKIDGIESEESVQKKLEERRSIDKSANASKTSKQKRILHDDSDDEDLMEENDSFADDEEEEKEREQSMFVDDEAMEVADGEESMDSEERAYIEENEVPVYAESIGSVDTEEDEYEEEPDEEDAAFVVSDTEVILQEDSDSDASKQVGKKYKRIVHQVDSSDEDSNFSKRKDDDFCLIVDSSMEDAPTKAETNMSMKDKVDTKSSIDSPNNSNEEIGQALEISKKIVSLDSSLLEKSAKSPGKRNSLKIKEEPVDIVSENIEAKEQENFEREPDNDAESVTSAEATDRNSSKKEKKSLNKKKSLGTEQEYMIASEEEVTGFREDIPVKNSKRRSLKNEDQMEEIGDESNTKEQETSLHNTDLDAEATEDVEAVPKKNLSKKERKSLNMGNSDDAAQKSLVMLEEDCEELCKDKPVKSPNKRKSVNKHEEVQNDNLIGNEMDTEDQRESFGDRELNSDLETSASKLSKKERKSLNKSKTQDQGNADNSMCSPYKRKSLKGKEASFIDCAATETKSPNKSLFQEETSTATPDKKASKKKRMSLNSKVVHESNAEGIDVMFDIGKSNENEDSNKETEITTAKESLKKSRLSLNKSKSEISRYDIEDHANNSADNEDTSGNTEHDEEENLPRNKSFHKSGNDSNEEQGAGVQTDESNSIQSTSRLDDVRILKSPKGKNNSPFKQSRKSLNKCDANEVGYDCFEGMSDKLKNNSNDVKDDTVEEGDEENWGTKNLNVTENSLNTSKNKKRKSLIRTSTEELTDEIEEHKQERSANKSRSEKSFLFVEDGSDTDATSAIDVSSRISEEKSQNSSRINRKSLNQSSRSDKREKEIESSPRKTGSANVYTNDETDSQNDEENEENPENDADNNENAAEMSKVMEFLGEEESEGHSPPNLNSTRRKSVNISKLDETFHLESNNAALSRRDSLHRNLLKKSLNQSKVFSESMNNPEHKIDDDDSDDESDVSAQFSAEEEEVEVVKKILPDKGLSVSLSGVECKKRKSKGIEEQVHKSFTIGVSLRNTTACSEEVKNTYSDSVTSKSDASLSEKDDLEKIENIQVIDPYKPRNSLSKLLSTSSDENKIKKKSKRLSLYMHGDGASQSFVENLSKEKDKLQSKRSRKSNSFCGVIAPSEEPEAQPEEPESPKSQTQASDASQSGSKTDIQRILSRCDEILEAANRAKLEAKMNAKKTKVKKPKWMDKEEDAVEEEEVKIPLVSKKELKRKEKMKKELAKAIKHSTAMLKTIDPKLVKKFKAPENPDPEETTQPPVTSKRLPADFLDELEEAPKLKKKKTKEIESTPPSDKENSKKSFNKSESHPEDVPHGEKKKKKHSKEILQTASGPVIVEPSTPTKLRYQNGFRESPKTPVGFKIQNINENDTERSRKRSRKLFSASTAFVEKGLPTSSKKIKKRKIHVEEPIYSLPKTQWTSSGVFVEEDVYTVHHPLANSTATQFMVTSLGGSKKPTKTAKVVSSATLSSALNFKKNALFNDKVKRESAHNLINRKERKLINNRY